MKNTAQVFLDAKISMAKFVVSLNPRDHEDVRDDAMLKVLQIETTPKHF